MTNNNEFNYNFEILYEDILVILSFRLTFNPNWN
jgi:hypothetical protein